MKKKILSIFISKQEGFTLVELLVVIGVLTILLTIVLIAINPARQFSQANNVQRRSDIATILNAIHQYSADNRGNISNLSIPATATNMGSDTVGGDVDMCASLVPLYVAELPADPNTGSYQNCGTYNTGYDILATTGAAVRITISAPDAELGETISITR